MLDRHHKKDRSKKDFAFIVEVRCLLVGSSARHAAKHK